ncbi:MAG: prepilin-type N-terminal cleavage/methylation domain-containing protein [Pseudomonadales bacterium]|nr:prepilin-type N-terminal cleavage/methylation domain-containing protein [Pseudomonadales bacterium]
MISYPLKYISSSKNKGFTLIELVISMSLITLLMLGISSLFMTFLLGSSKTNTKKTVKEEGIHALSQIEFLLKNALYVDENITPCTSGMTSIAIISADNGTTTFAKITDVDNYEKIASNSSALTSGAVTISSDPKFDCNGPVGNRQIGIDFELQKITPDGTVTEHFNSIVNLRN